MGIHSLPVVFADLPRIMCVAVVRFQSPGTPVFTLRGEPSLQSLGLAMQSWQRMVIRTPSRAAPFANECPKLGMPLVSPV